MNTQPINLEVSLEELNKILTALGNLPYVQVYELITNIQQQAEGQLQKKNARTNGISAELINS
jgi:predicted DNA-binding ArsR family transcriptional regulator